MDKDIGNILFVFFAIVIVFSFGFGVATYIKKKDRLTEAVKNGAAEWIVTVEPNGKVHKEFKWIKK